jgi:hypothetical protein
MHQEAEIREYLEKAIAEFKAINKATNYFLEKNPLIDSELHVSERIDVSSWVS